MFWIERRLVDLIWNGKLTKGSRRGGRSTVCGYRRIIVFGVGAVTLGLSVLRTELWKRRRSENAVSRPCLHLCLLSTCCQIYNSLFRAFIAFIFCVHTAQESHLITTRWSMACPIRICYEAEGKEMGRGRLGCVTDCSDLITKHDLRHSKQRQRFHSDWWSFT